MKREFHGGRRTRLYAIWTNMKARCLNPRNHAYPSYGGRGIGICAAWQESFTAFRLDMGDPPPGMTLERKDNNRGYEPDNCTWATPAAQSRNRRSVRLIEIDGVVRSITEWAQVSGIPMGTVWSRLKAGWPEKEAIFRPFLAQKDRAIRGKQGVEWCPASLGRDGQAVDPETGEILEHA